MPRPKIPVEDRLEIQELFAYYAWGLNTGDADQVLSCFTGDASFEHQPQGVFHGHEQIKILLNHLWYDKPGWFIGRQHLANHYFVFGLAHWDNLLTKAPGEWLFKSVRIHKWMGDDVPWAGDDRARVNAPAGPLI